MPATGIMSALWRLTRLSMITAFTDWKVTTLTAVSEGHIGSGKNKSFKTLYLL